MCRIAWTLTLIVFFVNSSYGGLRKEDLAGITDAFDSFADTSIKSNKAKDKIELDSVTKTPQEIIDVYETVPEASTEGQRVEHISFGDIVKEKVINAERAKSFVGCSVHLNISNPDLIQFAVNSFRQVSNHDNYDFVQLIEAVREVQNKIVYYLTVEISEKNQNSGSESSNIVCLLKIEHHPWWFARPLLVYQNCSTGSIENVSILDNDHEIQTTTLSDKEIISSINEQIIEVPKDIGLETTVVYNEIPIVESDIMVERNESENINI